MGFRRDLVGLPSSRRIVCSLRRKGLRVPGDGRGVGGDGFGVEPDEIADLLQADLHLRQPRTELVEPRIQPIEPRVDLREPGVDLVELPSEKVDELSVFARCHLSGRPGGQVRSGASTYSSPLGSAMSGLASCEIVPLADALARDGGDPVHELVDGEHPVLPEVQRLAVPGAHEAASATRVSRPKSSR